jgi:hypothetical protein
MVQRDYFGRDRKDAFERGIKPDCLADKLRLYRKEFGNSFTITDLIEIEKVRALALVAEAINDAPEFLIDQIGKARNSYEFPSILPYLESITEALRGEIE